MNQYETKCLNFYLSEKFVNQNHIISLCFYEDVLIRYLEDDFKIYISNPQNYISNYKQNGFLDSNSLIIAWEHGDIFFEDSTSIIDIFKYLRTQLSNIKFGNNDLELIAKLSVFFSYYSLHAPIEQNTTYSLYATYNLPFERDVYKFEFKIENYEIVFQKGEEEFKVKFDCNLTWLETNDVIKFNILAYSPLGYIKDLSNLKKIRNPHIIANKLELLRISNFIESTFAYLRVSSFDELKLKICTFSNSLPYNNLLTNSLSGDAYSGVVKLSEVSR